MISDNTIDAINAKYWCAFADKKLLKLIDKAMAEVSNGTE